ncbi:recombination associated protein RdgC [Modicisalibacter ilicicola DSM 19980]|uniref:Recombination-associated protein RdgC n=1 Tax=Modicisalibacter ilicicola DSM 19980 TaxID=1121942 RepID=A0A1M4ZFP5_9GAMM|nr:recombination-associated protein RdgC [Halomonas ilicicola]SHF16831.1 recombination associated protein RdgC [Halomonas ilicicola DSM 19980]
MWFKHLHLYRVHDAPALNGGDLSEALNEQAFRPLGGVEARRLGWSTPAGRDSERYLHEIQGHRLLSALRQERLLPASVVKEEVEARAADRETAEGRPLRRQEKQALKEQVYEEFLPRAFVRTQRLDLWWDTRRDLIGINASSRKRAEDVLDLLRQTLGSLKVTPLATRTPPTRAMTEWLGDATRRPGGLALGDQVELKASSGDDSVLRGRQMDLDGEEIQTALEAGRQATRLAFTIDESLSMVLADDLALKSLRFADTLLDEASQTDDAGDPVVRLETDFALMSNVLADSIEQLIDWLGGEATATASTP